MSDTGIGSMLGVLEQLCVEHGMRYVLVDYPDMMNDDIYIILAVNTMFVDKNVKPITVQAAIDLFTAKAGVPL